MELRLRRSSRASDGGWPRPRRARRCIHVQHLDHICTPLEGVKRCSFVFFYVVRAVQLWLHHVVSFSRTTMYWNVSITIDNQIGFGGERIVADDRAADYFDCQTYHVRRRYAHPAAVRPTFSTVTAAAHPDLVRWTDALPCHGTRRRRRHRVRPLSPRPPHATVEPSAWSVCTARVTPGRRPDAREHEKRGWESVSITALTRHSTRAGQCRAQRVPARRHRRARRAARLNDRRSAKHAFLQQEGTSETVKRSK